MYIYCEPLSTHSTLSSGTSILHPKLRKREEMWCERNTSFIHHTGRGVGESSYAEAASLLCSKRANHASNHLPQRSCTLFAVSKSSRQQVRTDHLPLPSARIRQRKQAYVYVFKKGLVGQVAVPIYKNCSASIQLDTGSSARLLPAFLFLR